MNEMCLVQWTIGLITFDISDLADLFARGRWDQVAYYKTKCAQII